MRPHYPPILTPKIKPLIDPIQRPQRLLAHPLIETFGGRLPISAPFLSEVYTRRDISCIHGMKTGQARVGHGLCSGITTAIINHSCDNPAVNTAVPGHPQSTLPANTKDRGRQGGCQQPRDLDTAWWPCGRAPIANCQITHRSTFLVLPHCDLHKRCIFRHPVHTHTGTATAVSHRPGQSPSRVLYDGLAISLQVRRFNNIASVFKAQGTFALTYINCVGE
jgi:hypothetical protein